MRLLYQKIVCELENIPFPNIWTGFEKMEFALYNNTKVYLSEGEIPYDERFLGNTSIDYNGRNIAIWYVEDVTKEDSKELAALLC